MSTYNDIRARFQVGLNKLQEKEVPVEIDDEAVGTVDDTDQQAIDSIKTVVSSAGSRDSIVDFLKGIGFPENEANNLFNVLAGSKDISLTAEYLLSRSITMGSLMNKVQDAKLINNNIGLSGKASDLFYSFSWRTSPPMGPGEPWLSTILKDGRRPSGSEKGDVIVDKLELEVKGPNGRLIGQSGYGDAKEMRNAFLKAIQNIAKSFKLKNFTPLNDTSDDGYWNVTKKEERGVGENLRAIAELYGKPFSKKELLTISNELITAYKSYLKDLDTKKYGSILIDVIGKDGSINLNKWHSTILTMYFEYYHSIEEFDYLALTRKDGKFLIMEVSKFKEFYDKGIIAAKSIPSFTDGAGSQGGTYGILLK